MGKFLFDIIEYVTRPHGWIVNTVIKLVKMFFKVKGWISKMMKAAGYDSIDAFCMFLAGDFIGLAIGNISGAVKNLWTWIKTSPLIAKLMGMVKGFLKIGELIFAMPIFLGKMFAEAGKAVLNWFRGKNNVGGSVLDIFVKPFKDWW